MPLSGLDSCYCTAAFWLDKIFPEAALALIAVMKCFVSNISRAKLTFDIAYRKLLDDVDVGEE